jgi:acid phosphatase
MRPSRYVLIRSACLLAGVAASGGAFSVGATTPTIPRFDHVVIAVMENEGWGAIIGSTDAPWINALAASGANFSNAHAITHPSQPNYIAMFSGSTQGVSDDTCPRNFSAQANLGSQLIAASLGFAGYSEDMSTAGYTGCSYANYRRKHNAWVDFDNVPAASNQSFSTFPTDYSTLPTLSFVVPNLCNDMHDCAIATGDTWLQAHLDGYVQWAKTHNSLFILIWDEDDFTAQNHIPEIFAGAHVRAGNYAETINHYDMLRTLEDMYGLAPLNNAAIARAITDVWDDGVIDRIFADGLD